MRDIETALSLCFLITGGKVALVALGADKSSFLRRCVSYQMPFLARELMSYQTEVCMKSVSKECNTGNRMCLALRCIDKNIASCCVYAENMGCAMRISD